MFGITRLTKDTRGVALIEFAFMTPIVASLCLGAFDVAMLVARQTELQEAAAEAATIAMAMDSFATDDTEADDRLVRRGKVEAVARQASGLPDHNVSVVEKVRCGNSATLQSNQATCASGVEESRLLTIDLQDTYTPLWTSFGVGEPIDLHLTRTVQIG
jgi:Flp pilus assembly protein TadG